MPLGRSPKSPLYVSPHSGDLDFCVADNPLVGTQRPGGWWVKGALRSGDLLLSRGKGYAVQNCRVPASSELRRGDDG